MLNGWDNQEVFKDYVAFGGKTDVYKRRLQRTMLYFSAFAGIEQCRQQGHELIVQEGRQSDSLYGFIDYVACTGEKASTEVYFHKQFATVTLQIINESFPMQDYSFIVSSGNSGLDMLSLKAVPGRFVYQLQPENDHTMLFRLLRQGDDSLTLLVTHVSGDSRSFPLGQYIRNAGYDWDATDLKDLYITLDISRNHIIIGVADWENTVEFELSTVEM